MKKLIVFICFLIFSCDVSSNDPAQWLCRHEAPSICAAWTDSTGELTRLVIGKKFDALHVVSQAFHNDKWEYIYKSGDKIKIGEKPVDFTFLFYQDPCDFYMEFFKQKYEGEIL